MPEKTITNTTNATLQLTLFVRQGDIPYLNSDTVSVELLPGETELVSYGDASNPYLNGVIMFTIFENNLYSKVQFITALQTELDTLLNTNNIFTITEVDSDYVLTGSNPSNPSLDQVNPAQKTSEIEPAIENPVQDVQNTHVIPTNIYVQQGATGNGSPLNPFGTIEEGLAAVNPNGTVHILDGTYPITSQINVTTEGITLSGEPGTTVLLQANVIPFLITASNTTLEGLTITSDIPYAVEFIQVAGANTRIIGNTIFGPEQTLPMSNWLVNRAIVPQGRVQNLLIENNTIYSLRTGLYVNPNVIGMITENTIYNTKGGILIDGALIVIEGNGWGIPANEVDIELLPGTTTGVPYEDVAHLCSSNNNAAISDQR